MNATCGLLLFWSFSVAATAAQPASAPVPLLKEGISVDWWFGFKFNAESAPECGASIQRTCLLGGTPQSYKQFGLQFAFASSLDHKLKQGSGCIGNTITDPL